MVCLPSASFAGLFTNFADAVNLNLIGSATSFLASEICIQHIACLALSAMVHSPSTLMAVLATVLACSAIRQEDLSFLLALLGADFSHRVEPHVRLARGAGVR